MPSATVRPVRRLVLAVMSAVAAGLVAGPVATADHRGPCSECASHKYWPKIDGIFRLADTVDTRYTGTPRSDELLGHHGSDVLRGGDGSDILWGNWDPTGQPTGQSDVIYGGNGVDFIYGSRGRNTIHAGAGNDVISVHYGRGLVDCGAGRDLYHVARSRAKGYTFRNCEKVDYRPEQVRGGPLKPLK